VAFALIKSFQVHQSHRRQLVSSPALLRSRLIVPLRQISDVDSTTFSEMYRAHGRRNSLL